MKGDNGNCFSFYSCCLKYGVFPVVYLSALVSVGPEVVGTSVAFLVQHIGGTAKAYFVMSVAIMSVTCKIYPWTDTLLLIPLSILSDSLLKFTTESDSAFWAVHSRS